MTYQLIVFDWDGTLMDSTGPIIQCMRSAITELELPPLSDKTISHIIGLGLPEAVQTLYPDASSTTQHALAEKYREIWLRIPEDMPLFENARNLISHLAEQDIFLGIATGKSRRGLDRVLKSTGLESYFVATRCADECHSKPHPQMIEELINYTGVVADATLMIGDTQFDLLMAHSAKAHSVGVTTGAHDVEKLQECAPKAILDDLFQVQKWLADA